MPKRPEGSGLNVEQGLSMKSPADMRRTAIGAASYDIFTGLGGSSDGGGAVSNDTLSGPTWAEQAPLTTEKPGKA